MARPRSTLVSVEDTPFYHCVSRCVRKAWLTGIDKYTGQSYDLQGHPVLFIFIKEQQIFLTLSPRLNIIYALLTFS